MNTWTVDLLEALIYAISPILVAAIGLLKYRNTKLEEEVDQVEGELANAAKLLAWDEWIQSSQIFEEEVRRLEEDTEIDRVLVFRAVNGFHDPKRTTQVYESRQPIPEQKKVPGYFYYPIEPNYVDMVMETIEKGIYKITVSELPNSAQIKGIYEAEGVLSSVWVPLYRRKGEKEGTWMINYASFSSHTVEEISEATIIRVKMLVAALQEQAIRES